ncbi:MAG: InlB B-repeat-containing protein [Muribaculaceae bacterium]|nr:InlB B-repeat-containing protein [Muribaculaceae bacterium]
MEKKRQILGFLSFCVFCIFALTGNVGAVTCEPSTYLDGDVCAACPDDYPESESGATSINQCYVHYEGKCEPGTCPENSRSCSWNTKENVIVDDYYGMPTNKTCPMTTLRCNKNYYRESDNSACKLCVDIPGTDGIYNASTGSGLIEQCYKVCTPMCVRDECPVHAECMYEDKPAGGGGIFYPEPVTTENCKPIVAVSCQMQVMCVDTGYTTFDPDAMTCNANTLTINYDLNGATDDMEPTSCLYDGACNAAAAPVRENWDFIGWNTSADGSGVQYAAGADIQNIISIGEITLYAQWNQLSMPCQAGKYYTGTEHIDCPIGSFCPGVGDAPAGESGCAVACPDGGTSDVGATAQSQCYAACAVPVVIKNGTLANINEREYYNEVDNLYPTCMYHATCDAGYYSPNNDSVMPKCVWENPANCPAGFYCPYGADEPLACPQISADESAPRGTSEIGARDATDCYYIFAPWAAFANGNASAKCKYTGDVSRYSDCNLNQAFSCNPGYYHLTAQTVGCSGVQQGYYSDGTNTQCLADNYLSAECVESLSQKACPDKDTDSTVASAEYASSITQCNKKCVRTDAHGTVSVARERVYANSDGVYDACQFTVNCDTGYSPADNGTENARCIARQYVVTLDKNGGRGDVIDNISCTFDSGTCTLPTVAELVRDGYSVVPKWCTESNGGGVCYDAGAIIASNISSNGMDITLYAVWTPNIYKIALNGNGAGIAVAPDVVYLKYATGWFADSDAKNPIAELVTLPGKDGYNFSGFFDQQDGGVRIISESGEFLKSDNALTFATDDVTIYARWAAGLTTCVAGSYYVGTGASCATCDANHYCLGGSFATDGGVAGMDLCPGGGLSAGGADNVSACYKVGIDYSAQHGVGTQTCHYDDTAQTYSVQCRDFIIGSCNAGYWLDVTKTQVDCSPVGDGFYSSGTSVIRTACPDEDGITGHTGIDTAVSQNQCWLENRVYNLDNGGALYGTGVQTCYYNTGASKYNDRCIRDSIKITSCNAGYWFDVAQNKYDCVPVGADYYSTSDDIARHACPAPRSPESGTPNTRGNTTTESVAGCFLTRELTTALHGHGQWGCFYNNDASVMDYTNCSNPEMYQCDAGYWYNVSVLANDCVAVGRGKYSPDADINIYSCPLDGYTLGDTSESRSQCLQDNVTCSVTNGAGIQTCAYGTDAYDNCACDNGCSVCSVTSCDAGTSLVDNSCIICPADNVCRDGTQQTCAVLTNNKYNLSDAGTTDVSGCWRVCPMADNAVEMTGREYAGGENTCVVSKCASGYNLVDGVCIPCPAGSYCDANGVINSCAALGNGAWNMSKPGSTKPTDCYTECKEHTVENGVAIPVNDWAYYDSVCEYRGKSDLGNDCDIVDNVCIETSCRNIYEMINGRCRPCNREHALAYAADGNCVITSCDTGWHVDANMCVSNTRDCVVMPAHATDATQTWDVKLNSFGVCVISGCDDGYHIESNACVPDVAVCDIENGVGQKEWNYMTRSWGNCIATSCDAGYTNDPSMTNERWKQCGVCKNKFSVLGEQAVAVSSWIRECEIAACMYQGQLYNLENNECVPICDINGYSDETGTMKWNPKTERCERTCKDGYVMW